MGDYPIEHMLLTDTDMKRTTEFNQLKMPTTVETLQTLESQPITGRNKSSTNTLHERSVTSANGKTANERRGQPKQESGPVDYKLLCSTLFSCCDCLLVLPTVMMRKNFTAKAKSRLSVEEAHQDMIYSQERKQQQLLYVQ